MTENEVAEILLVRSLEESNPDFFTQDTLSNAIVNAGEIDDDAAWIQRRASYLYNSLPKAIQSISMISIFPSKWITVLAIFTFIIGLGSNFLDQNKHVHIIRNPIIVLIIWNLLVYFLIFFAYCYGLLSKRDKDMQLPSTIKANAETKQHVESLDNSDAISDQENIPKLPAKQPLTLRFLYHLFPALVFRWNRWVDRTKGFKSHIPLAKQTSRQFWQYYWTINYPLLRAKFKYVIHFLAIILVTGAISGTYIRGLFSEYSFFWESTFIKDETVIKIILNIFLGIPSLIIDQSLIHLNSIEQLKSGSPAAHWIHLLSAAALMFVIIPRSLLYLNEVRLVNDLKKSFEVDIREQYFQTTIKRACETRAKRLREDIENIVTLEVAKYSESLAVFVREKLYNKMVVPKLIEFRNTGGRINDLIVGIESSCEVFEHEIQNYVDTARKDFQTSLVIQVNRLIGKELSMPEMEIKGHIQKTQASDVDTVGQSMTRDMTSAVGLAVTTAITLSIATVSGGFGTKLGVAIIVLLFGTTGPVGWIVGAIAGLLLGGGVSLLAKDKISDTLKNKKLPSLVVKGMLTETRLAKMIEEGRLKIYNDVKAEVEKELKPESQEIAKRIFAEIAKAINLRVTNF